MTGKTHAICGTVTMAAITVVCLTGDYDFVPIVGLLAAPTGSYMPDIDIHRSKMGSKFKFISRFLTHRGITHTLLVPFLLYLLQVWVTGKGIPVLPSLLFGFNVGWIVHIIADMFNKKGVPILWPLTKKHYHVASFLTSSWHEYVFIALWIVLNIAVVYLLRGVNII